MRFHRHSISFSGSSETGGFQVELWNCSLVERLPVHFWHWNAQLASLERCYGTHDVAGDLALMDALSLKEDTQKSIDISKTRKNMSLHHRHMMTHDLPQQVDFCVFFAMLSTLLSPEMSHQHQPQEDGSWQQRLTYQWSGATRFSLRPPVDLGMPKLHGSYSFHVAIWNYWSDKGRKAQ